MKGRAFIWSTGRWLEDLLVREGLEIGNLRSHNRALLAKWLWALQLNPKPSGWETCYL